MKISVYKLFGLINDEKAPDRIKIYDFIWVWTGDDYKRLDAEKFLITGMEYAWFTEFLKEEVEILDEEYITKEKEHKKHLLNKLAKNYDLEVVDKIQDKEENKEIPKHIPYEYIQSFDKTISKQDLKCIAHKVNEIINYLQHKEK